MVLRSLVVAACLLALWSVMISWLPGKLETGQGRWSENLIAAEHYLVDADKGATYVALVGSSLSQMVPVDSILGLPVYNLGLAGQGAGDGLNLLGAGKAPALLLVETNIILKEDNEDFSGVTDSPMRLAAIRTVPALRQRYQPVGVGLGLVRRAREKQQAAGPLADRPLNEAGLLAKRKEYALPVPRAEMEERLTTIRERLLPLAAAGTRVVFFEAPVHPELCDSPRANSLRTGIKSFFAAETYVYISQPECSKYFTTDGHHLGRKSSVAFADWLKQQLEQI